MKYNVSNEFIDLEEMDEMEEVERELRKRAREDKRLKDEIRKQRELDRYFDERDEW